MEMRSILNNQKDLDRVSLFLIKDYSFKSKCNSMRTTDISTKNKFIRRRIRVKSLLAFLTAVVFPKKEFKPIRL